MNDDPYTSRPTHLRVYREDTGDEYPWHIDGADNEGRFTEDVRRFETQAECLTYADLFVADTTYDGVKIASHRVWLRHHNAKQPTLAAKQTATSA